MLFFFLEILIIYVITRWIIKEVFIFLNLFFKNNNLAISIFSLLLLPGTVIHELAHYITAVILLLKVRKVSFWPKWNAKQILLGEVTYDKKDVVRGTMVGVAPFFAGLLILFLLFYFNYFPNNNLYLNIFFFFLIFSISTNMFSSRQDLKDFIFFMPMLFIIIFLINFLSIDINLNSINAILNIINNYLLIVIVINLSLFIFLKIINKQIFK